MSELDESSAHHRIIADRGTRHNGYSINRCGLLLLIKSIARPTALRDDNALGPRTLLLLRL